MSNSQNVSRTNAYEGNHGKTKHLERSERYVYGNGTIGHFETRHQAIGEAAIHARKDPFPFGEDFEHRGANERRRDILRRTSFVYTYQRREEQ